MKVTAAQERARIYREARKDFYSERAAATRKQKSPTGRIVQIVQVLWTNFLWSDSLRANVAARIQGVDWASLGPNESVLFLNSDLSFFTIFRMDASGLPAVLRGAMKLDSKRSQIDIAGVIHATLSRTGHAFGIKEIVGVPSMRVQDLVKHLDKSRASIDKVLVALKRSKFRVAA